MGGCCRWGWLVRQGDTPDEARIKTVGFPFFLFIFVVKVFLFVNTLQTTNQVVTGIGHSINAFACLFFMGGVVSNAIPAGYVLDATLVLLTVGLCALDLGNATISYTFRAWAFLVLMLDGALVAKRYHIPLFIIPFVLVYQAALEVESVSRFGLYELGYWGS
eukprot:Hpha_TRINITY_DN15590_c3_g1::TRINITY_DN15590_c3_g1_i8::g.106321::m.106321